jgi:dipeptidyl aminopeptidase/acylaminoacyl peptidase
MAVGTMFYNFLNELSSYGFLIIANGKPNGSGQGTTTYKDIIKSVDWVTTNVAAKKYGNVDTTKIIAAGQSCGALEAV